MSYAIGIKKNLKEPDPKLVVSKIPSIDLIYLINLDLRPEKLKRMLEKLDRFGIEPNRMAAIYGWALPDEVFQDVGLKFGPGMQWRASQILRRSGAFLQLQPPMESSVFHPRMTHGAVGTTLSHLSVLQHAYNANCQKIWVLEDDVTLQSDPHELSASIEKLDHLAGSDGWDVLYTDDVTHFEPFPPDTIYRPDMPDVDCEPMFEKTKIGDDFYKIGGRCQAHSMIIQRSGIEKILNFAMSRGIYLPYDVEIAFIPGIRFFNLTKNVVWGGVLENSDTDRRNF